MPESPVPQRIGRYDIAGVLGEGAMGVVYEGQDTRLHRRVAIKTILKSALDSDAAKEYSRRFAREAQAAARLNHPNIVQVFDFAEEGELAYIVMEFVKGRELKDFFRAKETFELKEIVHIMGELCDALHFAHEAGIIHRDIKPANVMIDSKGRVKLTDFGVARIADLERTVSERTQAGTILGTPAYMSPEQVQGHALDRRTDVFSAGVILYEFLTGERPFPGPGAWTIAKNILQLDPPRPSSMNKDVPQLFDVVVAKALAKDPKARYQTAHEMGLALKRVLDGVAAAEEAERTVTLEPPPEARAVPAAEEKAADPTEMRTVPNPAAPPIALPPRSREFELEFWRSIKDRNDPDDFDLYVQQFPSGIYAALARRRSAKLRGLAIEDSGAKAAAAEQEKREIEEAARREAEVRAKLAEEKAELEARLARREEELRKRESEQQAALARREAELSERERRTARRSPAVLVVAGLAIAVAGYGVWVWLRPPDPLEHRVAELTRLLEESRRREAELAASRQREAELLKELEQVRARAAEAEKAGDVARQRELAEQIRQREAEAAKQAALVRAREAEARKRAEEAERRRQELARLREEAARKPGAAAPAADEPKKAAAEAEARRQAEAEAARAREAEAKRQAEAEAARQREAEAKRAAEAEPKKAPEPAKVAALTPAPTPVPAPPPPEAAAAPDTLLARAIVLENEGKSADAARLLRQAARAKGRAAGEAAKRLGDMLQVGRPGVSRDYGEALRYYQIARENGVEPPVLKGR